MITINEAIDAVLAEVRPLPAEEVPLLEALGRAAAEVIVSPERVPAFDNSAMDGYAVAGAALTAGRREFSVDVDIPAGRWVDQHIGDGHAAKIMTGAPLPPGVDTVVPVELTSQSGDTLTVNEPVRPGSNVRRAAEDVDEGDVLFPRGAPLGPAEIGLLASVGYERVRVACRPRVAVLATGSELVAAGVPLAPGQIRNSNSITAYGQVLAAGAEPVLLGIARDELGETRQADRRGARTRRRAHQRRRIGRRVRFREAGAGGARRRAPLLGRRHEAGQAAGLRRARRHAGVRRAGQPCRGDGVFRALHPAGPPRHAGPCRTCTAPTSSPRRRSR